MATAFWFFVAFVVFFVLALFTALYKVGEKGEKTRALARILFWFFVWGAIVCLLVASFFAFTAFSAANAKSEVVQTAPTISPTDAAPAEAVQTSPTISPTNQAASREPTPARTVMPPVVNALVNPVLHHADSHPPENGVGSFDVGVKQGQIGLAFGWHIAWPKGGIDADGDGCDLVILTPGWYENLQVTDGRYEVYDVPSSDYLGWVKVLGQQRADEQAKDYGCPAKSFQDLPQWESTIPSPL